MWIASSLVELKYLLSIYIIIEMYITRHIQGWF